MKFTVIYAFVFFSCLFEIYAASSHRSAFANALQKAIETTTSEPPTTPQPTTKQATARRVIHCGPYCSLISKNRYTLPSCTSLTIAINRRQCTICRVLNDCNSANMVL